MTVIQLMKRFSREKNRAQNIVSCICIIFSSCYRFASRVIWHGGKIQVRLELALRDETIASSAVGVVKIRNSPVGHGLSAVRTNEDVHEVFLTFSRIHVHVHARETTAKLRELSHAGVSGMYYSCIHVPNVAVNPGIIVSFISSYLILRDFLRTRFPQHLTFMSKLHSLTGIKKKEKSERRSNTQAIFICCYYLITGFICAIDFTSVFKMTLS